MLKRPKPERHLENTKKEDDEMTDKKDIREKINIHDSEHAKNLLKVHENLWKLAGKFDYMNGQLLAHLKGGSNEKPWKTKAELISGIVNCLHEMRSDYSYINEVYIQNAQVSGLKTERDSEYNERIIRWFKNMSNDEWSEELYTLLNKLSFEIKENHSNFVKHSTRSKSENLTHYELNIDFNLPYLKIYCNLQLERSNSALIAAINAETQE